MGDSNAPPAVSAESLLAFQNMSARIVEKAVDRSLKFTKEVEQHGEEAKAVITEGLEMTSKILESAMAVGETSLLLDQLNWAKDRLPHEGVTMEHVLHRFQIYAEVIDELLPEKNSNEIIPFIKWMNKHIEAMIS